MSILVTRPAESKPRTRPRIAPWVVLLASIAGLFLVVELGVRFGLGRLSRIEGLAEREYRGVMALRGNPEAGRTVLALGNSLLEEGVDFPALRQTLAPDFRAVRYIMEQTQYLDWYYGLRRFYGAGVHPGIVALSLNAEQMSDDNIRGDYFAYRMMRTRDFWRASRDAHLSPTATFSLLLGSVSAFYGTRSETRNVLLARTVPVMPQLLRYMVPAHGPVLPDRERVVAAAAQRLRALDDMVHGGGGRFVFIIPASLDAHNALYLTEAGARAGVPVLLPLASESLSAADFKQDGFHLNAQGAARYTAALAPMLRSKAAELYTQQGRLGTEPRP